MSGQQEYVGTKLITAWALQSNGHPGYGVKCEDGYISWSPKATFEASYLPLGEIAHLPPHQQRVIAEKVELDDRLDKLQDFIGGDGFASLDEDEQQRLTDQADAMTAYSEIIAARIEAFGE